MNRSYIIGCTVGLLLLAASCSKSPSTAVDTRAADEKAVRDGEVAWNNDWASKDLDKIMSHYADNATEMIAGAPLMSGKDAIRTGLSQFLQDKNLSLSFTTASAEVAKSGDMAYTQGTYTLMQTDPRTKKPIMEKGKYVTVYKKQADGSWKAVEDINNADAPAASSANEPRAAKPSRGRKAARKHR